MLSIDGEFFAGGSTQVESAKLSCEGESVILKTEGRSVCFKLSEIKISDRLAKLHRQIYFPDGGMFITPDNGSVDLWLNSLGRLPGFSIVSFFENSWRWALLALSAIPVFMYLLFTVGMPLISRPLAATIPYSVKESLDIEIVSLLDDRLFEPSGLEEGFQDQITWLLEKFSRTDETELLFRKGNLLGANALALPGGTLIITDEMVQLVEYDGELAAVLAHEVGHVFYNHSMRNVLQTAGVSMVLGWVLGDLSWVTDIVLVGAPILLQQMSYSRNLEREADQYALLVLESQGYSTQCFSSLMKKLSNLHEIGESEIPDYLSSHPNMTSRIELGVDGENCSYQPSEINWPKKYRKSK